MNLSPPNGPRDAEPAPGSTPAPGSGADARPTVLPPGVTSWEQIVAEHSERVSRLAYRLTGNRSDAEDLTQEVFVRVFTSLHTYRPVAGASFAAWLHRITTNLFLDQARRRARIRFDTLGEDLEAGLARLTGRVGGPGGPVASGPAATDPVSSTVLESMFEDDVAAALAQLPPAFRVAVVLSDIEGLGYEEIADVLGVKIGTVRSRLSRGRAMLRHALAHRAPTGGRRRHAGPPALTPTP